MIYFNRNLTDQSLFTVSCQLLATLKYMFPRRMIWHVANVELDSSFAGSSPRQRGKPPSIGTASTLVQAAAEVRTAATLSLTVAELYGDGRRSEK